MTLDVGPRPAPRPVAGGAAEWTPRVMPPIGRDLDDRQKLACAFRILGRSGFSENIAGHITVRVDGTEDLLINPWGLWWEEISASDICRVSPDAEVLDGKWDVTPAIHIHTELHRRRPDVRAVVHNHPYYATVLAALGPSVEEATYRSATLDRQCRLMYDVLVSGRDHTLVAPSLRRSMKASLLERGTDFFWNGAVRALLRDHPEVVD